MFVGQTQESGKIVAAFLLGARALHRVQLARMRYPYQEQ
jgi:hypothetical protein